VVRSEEHMGTDRQTHRHTAGSHDGRHPLVEVVALGPCGAIRGRIKADLREFLLNPLR
jgi:hypothetical protein